MKLKTCPAGHFYNGDKFLKCPHCATKGKMKYDKRQRHIITSRLRHTKRLSESMKPVAGWMVCIKGDSLGQDIRLHQGRNIFFQYRIECTDNKAAVYLQQASPGQGNTAASVKEIAATQEQSAAGVKKLAPSQGKTDTGAKELTAGKILSVKDSRWLFVPFENRGYW